MAATVDLSKFARSVSLMAMVPKKNGPDVLNKSVLKIGLGSKGSAGLVQLTQKANKSKIKRDLKRGGLLLKLATQALKRQGEHKKGGNWNSKVRVMANRILAARLKSAGYIASGWLFACGQLAKRVPGAKLTRLNPKTAQKWEGGTAADSAAMAATITNLTSGLFNSARGAGMVCPDSVLQMAINEAERDNKVYLEKKFGAGIHDAINGTRTLASVADP